MYSLRASNSIINCIDRECGPQALNGNVRRTKCQTGQEQLMKLQYEATVYRAKSDGTAWCDKFVEHDATHW